MRTLSNLREITFLVVPAGFETTPRINETIAKC